MILNRYCYFLSWVNIIDLSALYPLGSKEPCEFGVPHSQNNNKLLRDIINGGGFCVMK